MSGAGETPHILFEDNHLVVAVKLPGILSQADGSASLDMLTLIRRDLKIRYNKPGEVFLGLLHRLDQPVGGLMVFARTSKAAARMSQQIREHRLAKLYLAVVRGLPAPDQGSLADQLEKDPATRNVRVVKDGSGQSARLDYRVLSHQQDLDLSLVAIRLETGRSHQIRVQLASRGWPIVNDFRYGAAAGNKRGVADIALFAAGLGFSHPISREWMQFSAPPPAQAPWNVFDPGDFKDVFAMFAGPE